MKLPVDRKTALLMAFFCLFCLFSIGYVTVGLYKIIAMTAGVH